MWLPFAVVAAFLTSFLPIINKRLLQDADVAVVAWGFNALSLPLLGVAAFSLLPATAVDAVFWAGIAASAALNLLATLVSTQALKAGDASLVTPFLTFNPAFTALIAVFTLGEVPSATGLTGIGLILAGSYAMQLTEARIVWWAPLRAMVAEPAIALSIGASLVWGLTPIPEKIAIQHTDPANPPLVALGSTALMALGLTMPLLGRVPTVWSQLRQGWRGFCTAGLIAGVAPVFGFSAIGLGLVGYVSAIFKLSAVFTVLWAALVLKETGLRDRLLGAALMVAGAILLGV